MDRHSRPGKALMFILCLAACSLVVVWISVFLTEESPDHMAKGLAPVLPQTSQTATIKQRELRMRNELEREQPVAPLDENRAAAVYASPEFEIDKGTAVRQAIATGSPTDAASALLILNACQGVLEFRDGLERYKTSEKGSRRDLRSAIESVELESRVCQTIDPSAYDSKLDLARRALSGGVPGSALPYARLTDYSGEPNYKSELGQALVRDALSGDYNALSLLAARGGDFGLGRVDVRAYAIAAQELAGERNAHFADVLRQLRWAFVMSAEEESQAQALATKIVSTIPAKK